MQRGIAASIPRDQLEGNILAINLWVQGMNIITVVTLTAHTIL